MSVKIPILVNDQCVGSMIIVRIVDGLSQAELDNDKRTHEYRWEIIEDRPHETRRATGTPGAADKYNGIYAGKYQLDQESA